MKTEQQYRLLEQRIAELDAEKVDMLGQFAIMHQLLKLAGISNEDFFEFEKENGPLKCLAEIQAMAIEDAFERLSESKDHYMGGYRTSDELDAFHHGLQTQCRVLSSYAKQLRNQGEKK